MDQILSVNIPAPTISSSWDIAAPVDVQAVEPVWADASPAAQLALATSAVALADLTVDGAGPQSLAETAQSISLPVAQPTTAAAESLLSQDFDPRAIIDSLLIATDVSPILEASNPTSLAEVTQAAESLNDPTLRTVLVSMSIVGSILLVLIGLFLLYRYAILTKLRAKLHPDLLSAPDMKSKDSGEYPTHVVVDQEPIKRFSTLSSTRSTAPPRKNSMRVSNAAAGRAIPMSTQRRSTSWMHSQSRPQGGYSWKFEKAAASNTTAIPHQKSIIMPDNTPAHTMIVTQEYLAVYLDELTLAIGDLVYPVEVYNDGWAFGTKATGEEGIFPMNHLEDVISF